MKTPSDIAAQIADAVQDVPSQGTRFLVAVAGPPASGKSTIAERLVQELTVRGRPAGLLGMDGFHIDNTILTERRLLARKGAPETFDLAGFKSILHRLSQEDEVIAPTFDRARDASIGSSSVISPDMGIVVVEGNYLLLDAPGWRDLHGVWDYRVKLDVPAEVTEQRLLKRWSDHGYSSQDAQTKIAGNDMPNTRRVSQECLPADLTIS